ncbi:hypothetical protein [Natronorubrum halophilum]|uniref:hypothetical protein n=1 Tax=Natronorubrum halophilum TaxID=1702106 RepID=UPI0010C18505|nr:hypothetical protein [Natronorubrum halophilum]
MNGDAESNARDSPPVSKAIQLGRKRARSLRDTHESEDPLTIADELGVEVTMDDWDGLSTMSLFGTYANGRITLYVNQIDGFAETHALSRTAALRLVCAHELGHHLIETNDVVTREQSSVFRDILTVFGVTTRPSNGRRLVETATHAFALELTGVDVPLESLVETPERRQRRDSP